MVRAIEHSGLLPTLLPRQEVLVSHDFAAFFVVQKLESHIGQEGGRVQIELFPIVRPRRMFWMGPHSGNEYARLDGLRGGFIPQGHLKIPNSLLPLADEVFYVHAELVTACVPFLVFLEKASRCRFPELVDQDLECFRCRFPLPDVGRSVDCSASKNSAFIRGRSRWVSLNIREICTMDVYALLALEA